jgi:surfeit locus 1 family protein
MMRRIPVIPTIVVLAAITLMIRLGFWQIDRLHEKEALLARYAAAPAMSAEVPFPQSAAAAEPVLYRHSRLNCEQVTDRTAKAGENLRGENGQAHYATCTLAGGGTAQVVLGWSRALTAPDWRGGEVAGTIAPGPRLVVDPPVGGLEANARPNPAELPNNHLSYAGQWFLFALVALVIYALALRKRLADAGERR